MFAKARMRRDFPGNWERSLSINSSRTMSTGSVGDIPSVHLPRRSSEGEDNVQSRPYPFIVYKRRWYMLAVLCILNFANAMVWITYAPVANYAAKYYDKSPSYINWMSIVFFVASVAVGLTGAWIMDSLGLRVGILTASWLTAIGAAVRALSSYTPYKYWLALLGQTLASLAQPVILAGPTKLAAVWFSDHQRATANTISSMANPLGILAANALAPYLVTVKDDIPFMLKMFAIPAGVAVVMATFGVCSSSPPSPPSASAALISEPFFVGCKKLVRNKDYIILLICFGGGIALYSTLATLLQQIICIHGYDDETAGLCGAFLIGLGIVGAGIAGVYVDVTKHFATTAKVSYAMAALSMCFFSVMSGIPEQKELLILSCSLFGMFGFALMPVCLEVGVECTYPVAEATSSGVLWMGGQITGILLLLLSKVLSTSEDANSLSSKCPTVSSEDLHILNYQRYMYFLEALTVIYAILFIAFFKPKYKRLQEESQIKEPPPRITYINPEDNLSFPEESQGIA